MSTEPIDIPSVLAAAKRIAESQGLTLEEAFDRARSVLGADTPRDTK